MAERKNEIKKLSDLRNFVNLYTHDTQASVGELEKAQKVRILV